jgi:hypothetical protein
MTLKSWAEQLRDTKRSERQRALLAPVLASEHGKPQHLGGHKPGERRHDCPRCQQEAEQAALRG